MFVGIVHFKFLLILNNDVNDICIVYAIPEKSTQLIEYYWDCIPVIGLRPESVHTRNGLGANSYTKVHIFSRLAKSDFAQKRSVASLSEFLYYIQLRINQKYVYKRLKLYVNKIRKYAKRSDLYTIVYQRLTQSLSKRCSFTMQKGTFCRIKAHLLFSRYESLLHHFLYPFSFPNKRVSYPLHY